jgi:hypothetical protein
MATMYENLCGNCVGGVELTFHKRALDFFFIPLQVDLTFFKIARHRDRLGDIHFRTYSRVKNGLLPRI